MITLNSLRGKRHHQFPPEVRALIKDVWMKFGPHTGSALEGLLEGESARIHELVPAALSYTAERAKFHGVEFTSTNFPSAA